MRAPARGSGWLTREYLEDSAIGNTAWARLLKVVIWQCKRSNVVPVGQLEVRARPWSIYREPDDTVEWEFVADPWPQYEEEPPA